MSNDNTTLALALGAGTGVGLWYLLRDGDAPKPDDATTAAPLAPASTSATATATAPAAPTAPAPCSLRLDAKGLTADGSTIDIPTAVTLCQAAGRADLVLADDAPSNVYADLGVAFTAAGILINPRRNRRNARGARRPRPRRSRRQSAANVDLPTFAAMVQSLAEDIDEDPTPAGLARSRFGRKVFLAAIRRALRRTEYASLKREVVDRLLVSANREGLLELARADLVAVMDPAEVRDSEIQHLMSTWHFVVAERPEGRNATSYHHFTLRSYPEGKGGRAQVRHFHADPATSWKDAYYRLISAGVVDARVAGRTHEPGGWMLSVDPADYRAQNAERLP